MSAPSAPPTTIETGPGFDPVTGTFRSRLGYTIDVPDRWRPVDDVTASDALVGPSGSGMFRVRVYDRPNRTSFIDAVESGRLPDLAQAVTQLAREFPGEFGSAPTITALTVGGRPAWRLVPSSGASTPTSVTYLVDFVGGSFRFLEITVDADHDDAITPTLRWDNP